MTARGKPAYPRKHEGTRQARCRHTTPAGRALTSAAVRLEREGRGKGRGTRWSVAVWTTAHGPSPRSQLFATAPGQHLKSALRSPKPAAASALSSGGPAGRRGRERGQGHAAGRRVMVAAGVRASPAWGVAGLPSGREATKATWARNEGQGRPRRLLRPPCGESTALCAGRRGGCRAPPGALPGAPPRGPRASGDTESQEPCFRAQRERRGPSRSSTSQNPGPLPPPGSDHGSWHPQAASRGVTSEGRVSCSGPRPSAG